MSLPELRINLDENGDPEEILFEDLSENKTNESLEITLSFPKAKKAFLLLALHTAKHCLLENKDSNSRWAAMPKKYQIFTNSLAEPITNPKPKSDKSHWLSDLFGSNPYGKYLDAKRKNFCCFLSNVKVNIYDYDDNALKIKDVKKIDSLILEAAVGKQDIRKGLMLSVEVDSPSKGYDVINESSIFAMKTLSEEDEIKVIIEEDMNRSICIFWLDSERSIYQLYPHIDPDLDVEFKEDSTISGKLKIEIPDVGFMRLGTGKGVESCFVMALHSEFNEEELEKIGSLVNPWPRNQKMTVGDVERVVHSRREVELKRKEEIRLKPPRRIDQIKEKIMLDLSEYAIAGKVLHIPNIGD